MPPKRKQTEDSTQVEGGSGTRSTRSTRSSTTNKAESSTTAKATKKTSKTISKKSTGNDNIEDESDEPAPPPAKKAKTATKKVAAPRKGKATNNVDEPHPVQKPPFVSDTPSKHSQSNHVTESSESTTAPPAVPAKAPASGTTKPAKNEPYTPARAESLFKQYADRDDANVIGAEGFEKLCADANVNLEGAQALIMAWQFNTGEMMKITKAEWTAGTGKLQVSSPLALSQAIKELDDLLMEGKPPVQQTTKKDTLYDRALYQSYVADPTSVFLKFYMFCFNLVKPAQSKNIEMETSVAFWSVLLVPKYPIMAEVLEFIKESGTTYKATNKDLWSMMLEFCRTVSPNLTDYEADGAWPTLLDDFVAWKRKKADMSGDGAADAQ